jgi:hypothetical protein
LEIVTSMDIYLVAVWTCACSATATDRLETNQNWNTWPKG